MLHTLFAKHIYTVPKGRSPKSPSLRKGRDRGGDVGYSLRKRVFAMGPRGLATARADARSAYTFPRPLAAGALAKKRNTTQTTPKGSSFYW